MLGSRGGAGGEAGDAGGRRCAGKVLKADPGRHVQWSGRAQRDHDDHAETRWHLGWKEQYLAHDLARKQPEGTGTVWGAGKWQRANKRVEVGTSSGAGGRSEITMITLKPAGTSAGRNSTALTI